VDRAARLLVQPAKLQVEQDSMLTFSIAGEECLLAETQLWEESG
jgi:hypothetical protein